MKHARPDYNRIQDPDELIPADEPVFLLRGQDPLASSVVEFWARCAKAAGADAAMVQMAMDHAKEMRQWTRRAGKHLPDLPPPAVVPLRAGHDFPCAIHRGPAGDCTEQNCRCG